MAQLSLSGCGAKIYHCIGMVGAAAILTEYSNGKEDSSLVLIFNLFEGKFTCLVFKLFFIGIFTGKIDCMEWENCGDVEDSVLVQVVVAEEVVEKSYDKDSSRVWKLMKLFGGEVGGWRWWWWWWWWRMRWRWRRCGELVWKRRLQAYMRIWLI